jgi:hypothetical protein
MENERIIKLHNEHFKNMSLIDEEYYSDIYNFDDDILVNNLYDFELVEKVFDYYLTYDLSFITKQNYKQVFDIFLYYGTYLGILLAPKYGNIYKKLFELCSIDLQNENIEECERNYEKVINFKNKIYNHKSYQNYRQIVDWYIDELNLHKILNYKC